MKSVSAVELGPSPIPRLQPHTSRLPDWLYILSFAPPVPSPFRRPRAFFSHPYILYAIAFPCALISGVCMPAYDIVFGHWTNGIKDVNSAPWYLVSQGSASGWRITMVGAVALITTAAFQFCFTLAGYKLSRSLRETYLSAVIVQDQAFLDRVGPGEIISRSTKDIELVRVGLGERLGYLTQTLSVIVAGFTIAFITLPKLAGVLFALVPFTFLLFTGVGYWAKSAADAADTLEGKTASYVEQILSSLRIVQSFNMSERLLLKLQYGFMKPLRKLSLIKTSAKGVDMGIMYGAGLLSYSMAFWYGGIEVTQGASIGSVLTVFYNYVNLCFSFGGVMPHLIAIITALHSLSKLRMQIERKPIVDVREQTGTTLGEYQPSFALEGVTFAYPARPSIKALDNASISIPPGKFTAVVGPSGSGKSTMASLLLRMYDPTTAMTISDLDRKLITELDDKGEVTEGAGIVRFAGRDIRDLDVMWLRRQVAVVWQNPQLISGTIFDNVAIGLTGQVEEYSEKGTSTEMDIRVEEALRIAQAWDFVTALPEGLQTKVSAGRTGVLSGGQVQRIALARALVRRPRCLLLDEATSAVSADTEMLIQESLLREQRKHGMTLVVIAHRLSTVVAADKIIVMVGGKPAVEGTYEALMDPECPDQTFRSMALPHERQETPEESKAPSRTETIEPLLVAHMDDFKPQRLPPPLKSVKQAFLHVAYLLGGGILIGLVGGVAFVLCGFLFGRAASALNNPVFSVMREQVNRWALWFLIVAIGTMITIAFHAFALEFSGERLVAEFRREIVRAFVRQETAFFETETTSSGSLTAAAAQHPSNVGAFIGLVLSQIVISFANLVGTLVLALSLDWRIGVMAFPSLAFSTTLGYLNFRFSGSYENDITEDGNQQAKFVGESVNSLALIAASTMEAETVRQFSEKFCSKTPSLSKLFGTAVTYGGGMASGFFFGGLLFWWGSLQVSEGNTTLANLWSTFEATIIAMYVSSKVFTYLGDMTRMVKSLKTMQVWLKREPAYTTKPDGLPQLLSTPGIVFDQVELRYPSRKDVLALNKVSLRMEPGKSYAFCGTSGAGKSTILAVLQRFYDITGGQVLFDGRDIRDMEVDDLRNQMGYVSQEAILFEETIRWNLTSGAIDPKSVTQEDLDWACEQACILSFIRSLPEGFETDLGTKGGQLSGGQRQRLCIARALLRRPKILLLDEATSALDGESEAHVQRAIDNASKDRTVITVAHRLSTIRKADVIYVMEQGQVVESGSHEELLEKKGRYYELVQVQL